MREHCDKSCPSCLSEVNGKWLYALLQKLFHLEALVLYIFVLWYLKQTSRTIWGIVDFTASNTSAILAHVPTSAWMQSAKLEIFPPSQQAVSSGEQSLWLWFNQEKAEVPLTGRAKEQQGCCWFFPSMGRYLLCWSNTGQRSCFCKSRTKPREWDLFLQLQPCWLQCKLEKT